MLFQTPLDRLERWLKILLGRKSTPGPLPRAALPGDTVAAILAAGELQDEDQVYATVELPDRSRVNIGYLTSVGDIRGALRRGWVRCWFAEARPTTAHPTGAAVIFVVIYDPR